LLLIAHLLFTTLSKEIERELKHQESVNRGKRTTRLSAVEIKQSDLMGPRTSERRAERQREAERAYKEREEAEQLAKERAREERQREREERALQRQEAIVRQREKEELDRVEALEREKLAEELRLNPHKSGTKTTAKLKELTKAATTPKGKKQTPRKMADVAKKGQQKAEEEDWIVSQLGCHADVCDQALTTLHDLSPTFSLQLNCVCRSRVLPF
jgi:membrane protein involved in colicin uptake